MRVPGIPGIFIIFRENLEKMCKNWRKNIEKTWSEYSDNLLTEYSDNSLRFLAAGTDPIVRVIMTDSHILSAYFARISVLKDGVDTLHPGEIKALKTQNSAFYGVRVF